ncbi:3-methyl-2-oxobutanoate hydroxymethyltransferase [Candidatus Bathyarchaeota archaeon]|nr:3-methyl-2-oxobutanoate hydroxymethyltransferase [Candidatus Bathyarchaeota archaeon]
MGLSKVTVSRLLKMKERGEKITMITAYDYPTGLQAERAGIDMVLVGDSVGMVMLGYANPVPVTVDDIVHHTKPVVRGAKTPLVVADMPFMSYHISLEETKRNAARLIQEGGADAVKLEGGKEVALVVKALVDVGIPVQAHIGLMPQRASVGGAFKVQGKEAKTAEAILEDALALEAAGAFSVVVEFVTAEAGRYLTENLKMPTIGIGAGPYCDGQVLLSTDLLGVYDTQPAFVKLYANLNKSIHDALTAYREDVKKGKYPSEEYLIHMEKEEMEKLGKK